jgi:hypothetical protein
MPPMSKIELYAAIRRDARVGMAKRAIQRKHGVGFLTVQKALTSAWPEPQAAAATSQPAGRPQAGDRPDAAGRPGRTLRARMPVGTEQNPV